MWYIKEYKSIEDTIALELRKQNMKIEDVEEEHEHHVCGFKTCLRTWNTTHEHEIWKK